MNTLAAASIAILTVALPCAVQSVGARLTASHDVADPMPFGIPSLHITGTVAQWESWTQLRFPETGDYVFPAGLTTVHIDRDHDLGEYWEPNIWIIHHVSSRTPG